MQESRKKTFLLFLLSCLPYGLGLNFAFSFVESQCSWRSIQNHESTKLGKIEKTKTETNKECRNAGTTHFCFSCFPAFLIFVLFRVFLLSCFRDSLLVSLSRSSFRFDLWVYPTGQPLPCESVAVIIVADFGHGVARADRRAGDVLRDHDVRQLKQWSINQRRLRVHDIQPGRENRP